MKKQTLENFLKDNPQYNHRKYIPTIVEAITGISPEDQIQVKVAIRRLQELIPNDAKGKRLEAEWRDERGMKSQGEFVRIPLSPLVDNQLFNLDQLNYKQ